MNPSSETLRAASEAMESYRIFHLTDKKMPILGGTDDQEYEWIEALACVSSAYDQIEYEERKKEEERMRAQQAQAKKPH